MPLLQPPFMGEVGLPGARTGGRLPQNSDTQQVEFERTAVDDSTAKHLPKAKEAVASTNAVILEDFERRS